MHSRYNETLARRRQRLQAAAARLASALACALAFATPMAQAYTISGPSGPINVGVYSSTTLVNGAIIAADASGTAAVVAGGATLSMLGGEVNGTVRMVDTSHGNYFGITGGTVNGSIRSYRGMSQTWYLAGGRITGDVLIDNLGNDRLIMSGGEVGGSVEQSGQYAQAKFLGGTVRGHVGINIVRGTAQFGSSDGSGSVIGQNVIVNGSGNAISILGGLFEQNLIFNGSFNAVSIYGGLIDQSLIFNGGGNTLDLWGGDILGSVGTNSPGSNTLNIHGWNLGFENGLLTGFLADGRAVNQRFSGNWAAVNLFNDTPLQSVPEPSGLMLVGLGLALAGGRGHSTARGLSGRFSGRVSGRG